ncbi:MAG TPA: FAD-dependent oxidoreductase [Solirubrobacterales bacterium]
MTAEQPTRVLIAGGGVAGVEALLALRRLAGSRVQVSMLAPEDRFRFRPLSVTEPFGLGAERELDLLELALEQGATFLRDGLAVVDPEARRVTTFEERTLDYDALLLALGTRQVDAVPGAVTFRDSADGGAVADVIDRLKRGEIRRVAFAVPVGVTWPLGIYELALLAAHEGRDLGLEDLEFTLVTPESRPLEVFGAKASAAVADILAAAGIGVRLATPPVEYADGRLAVAQGEPLACDAVVALPVQRGYTIPGIPQDQNGFVAVDRFGAVFGLERVYAAGDMTWFPVKQGGIAAQMADVAARSIAALAGAPVDPEPFRPVLRGALLTGGGPRYLRTPLTEGEHPAVARNALWWPPAKIAGRYLAPYLHERAGYPRRGPKSLEDLEPRFDPGASADDERDDVIGLALATAEAEAKVGDYGAALRWLEVVEDLDLYLPREYELKREAWRADAAR